MRNSNFEGEFYEGGVPIAGTIKELEGLMRYHRRLRRAEIEWKEIAKR